MKKLIYILVSLVVLGGCQTINPFEVVNPNLSEEAVLGQPNSSKIWLNGIERQMAIATNWLVIPCEIASDNYVNLQTFYNQFLDDLDIQYQDNDMNVAHRGIGRVRASALYGLSNMGPEDPEYSAETEAAFNFYAGVAYLWGGMYFRELPGEPDGPLLPRETHFNAAIQYFDAALAIDGNNAAALLGRARANYYLGNKAAAVADANAAIAADGALIHNVNFDPVNAAGNRNGFNYTKNDLQLAIQERGGFDDLQPLPRLDFLDPKLYSISGTEDSPIALFKIEEAHLILAEAQLSDGDLPGAQQTMKNIIALVGTRPTATFDDSTEDRFERDPGSRPDTSAVVVDGKTGLVLNRKDGPVTVPTVSGTSLTDADVDALTTAEEALATLYLMRQEIFIAEGHRSVDMGLTWVISEIEALQNENIGEGHPSTQPDIPPFINAVKTDIDAFTYDPNALTCSITVDINAIIAANATSDYVCPFH